MFAKLALRNVRRQIHNYLIYFITVSLSVAMLFAINSLSYSEPIRRLAEMSNDMKFMFRTVITLASLVTALVLSYAAAFILKLRKKEFGMYLTMGMTRKNIQLLYVCETGLMTIFATAVGMAVGLVIFQFLSALFAFIMDFPSEVSVYSTKGILLTVAVSTGMFLLSTLASLRYLRKTTLSELLKEESTERSENHPILWCILSVLTVSGLIVCLVMTYQSMMAAFHNASVEIVIWLILDMVMIFLSHAALAKGVIGVLLRNEKLKNRGTNAVILRSLSSKMTVNALLIGALAALLTFAVVMANISFGDKLYSERSVAKDCPYDVMAMFDLSEKQGISMEEGQKIIETYSPIIDQVEYQCYSTGESTLSSNVMGWEEMGWTDKFIPLSQFNGLLTDCGYEPISLENSYQLVTKVQQIYDVDFSDVSITLGDRTYFWEESSISYPNFTRGRFYFVVPDEAVTGMKVSERYIGYTLENDRPDALALLKALTYERETEDGLEEECDYWIQEEHRLYMLSTTGTLIIGTLYIATVFVCLALAVLSLKTLSTMDEERRRFAILFRLGVDSKMQKKTLFRQILVFFMAPFALPLLATVPLGCVFGEVYKIWGFTDLGANKAMETSVMISLLVTLVWGLYFIVTYRIACDNVICYGNEERMST